MPLMHCNTCHHEWEDVGSTKTHCGWCGEPGYVLKDKTELEDMMDSHEDVTKKGILALNGMLNKSINTNVRDEESEMNKVSFRTELEGVINKYSMENGSNTPDFILAEYLCDCLRAFDRATADRTRWYRDDGGSEA